MKVLKGLLLVLLCVVSICACKDDKKDEENDTPFSIARKWYFEDNTSHISAIWDFSESTFSFYVYDDKTKELTVETGSYTFDGSNLKTSNIVSRKIENDVFITSDTIGYNSYYVSIVNDDAHGIPDLIIGAHLYKDFNICAGASSIENKIQTIVENAKTDEAYVRTMSVVAGDEFVVRLTKKLVNGFSQDSYTILVNSTSIENASKIVKLTVANKQVTLTDSKPCLVYKNKTTFEALSLMDAAYLYEDKSVSNYCVILYLDVDANNNLIFTSPELCYPYFKNENTIVEFVK